MLKNAGHVLIRCSNCNGILMDIWRTRPDEPETWTLIAHCPFCNDKSFETHVKGGFHAGGYGVIKPDDDSRSDDFPSTVIDYQEEIDGKVHFYLKKADPKAKAIKYAGKTD